MEEAYICTELRADNMAPAFLTETEFTKDLVTLL